MPLGAVLARTLAMEAAFFKVGFVPLVDVAVAARRGKREVLVGIPDGFGIEDLGGPDCSDDGRGSMVGMTGSSAN